MNTKSSSCSDSPKPVDQTIPCSYWCETGVFTISSFVHAGYRLSYDNSYRTEENGIQWSSPTQLDDLDFADDLPLLSHTQQQMQEKTNTVAETSRKLGLKIQQEKTKIFKVSTADSTPITRARQPLKEGKSFTYLGGSVDKREGTVADVKIRIGKTRAVFLQLKNVWTSIALSEKNQDQVIQLQC